MAVFDADLNECLAAELAGDEPLCSVVQHVVADVAHLGLQPASGRAQQPLVIAVSHRVRLLELLVAARKLLLGRWRIASERL